MGKCQLDGRFYSKMTAQFYQMARETSDFVSPYLLRRKVQPSLPGDEEIWQKRRESCISQSAAARLQQFATYKS